MPPLGPAGDDGWRRYRRWLEAPLRRPWLALAPILAGVVGGWAMASLFTPRYEAAVAVRAQWEQGDEGDAARLGLDLATRRARVLRQQLLRREATEAVLEESNPYPAGPDAGPGTGAAARLLTSVSVEARGEDEFLIRYVHADATKAAVVPNRLAERLVAEAEQEAARAGSTFADPRTLAERLEAARQAMEQAEQALRRLGQKRLTAVDEPPPAAAVVPPERQARARALALDLAAARTRAETLRSAVAQAEARAPAPEDPRRGELDELRAERARLRQRYTERHPDVEALDLRIGRLEAALPPPTPGSGTETASLRAQLAAAESEIEALSRAESQLAAEGARAAAGGGAAPPRRSPPDRASERARLAKALDDARAEYAAVRGEWEQAETRSRLGRTAVATYAILEPAAVPTAPVFPNPTVFALLGLLLGLLIGLGASLLAELRDPTVRDAEDLRELLHQPILAEIPLAGRDRDR